MNLPSTVAELLYRFKRFFVVGILAGAAMFAPQADLTSIDNDLGAWIAEDDPEYQTYERFREEFGGTRSLIVAFKSDRIFSPAGLQFIEQVSRDLEQAELVGRVSSLASANIVRPIPATDADDGGIEVSPLVEGRCRRAGRRCSTRCPRRAAARGRPRQSRRQCHSRRRDLQRGSD